MGYAAEQPRQPNMPMRPDEKPTRRQKLIMIKSKRRQSKKAFMARFERLKEERTTWLPHWREVAELTIPRRIKPFYEARQRGEKMHQKIFNGTPTRALRILTSGLISGISSPARPWFRLITPYPELMKTDKVRSWLHHVEETMRTVFARSNIYQCLALVYRDLGDFGTAAMCVEADPKDVIRGYSYTPGTYVIQNNARNEVDTIYREIPMTVGQVAERFGFDQASDSLQRKWEANDIDAPVRILHCIEPNETYDATQLGKAGKKFRSVWLEADAKASTTGDDEKPLFEGNGFNEFPAMCPRWDRNSEEIYGASPAMEALGDMKELMKAEKRCSSIYDKISAPPMTGPSSLENKKKSQLAGDITYVDTTPGSQKFEPAFTPDPRALFIEKRIENLERRIMQQFYADLFLMLASMEQGQPITAREVDERHEEKMLQLGPVLESLHNELLTPLINRTFEIMVRAGLIPPPPAELAGMELRVEFISILAQAQKLLGTAAVERLLGFIGNTIAVFPEAKDKIDIDVTIDDYAMMLGTNPDIVRTGDTLEQFRQQRAQQEQAAAMAAAAKPAKDASEAALNISQMQPPGGQPGGQINPQSAQTLAGADSLQPGVLANLINTIQPGGLPYSQPTAS